MPRTPAPPSLPEDLLRLADLRGGVITTRDVRRAGIDHSGVRSLLRAGIFFQVLRGAYSLRADHGPRERSIAAALVCHPRAVVSLEAAATLLGWRRPWSTDVTDLWLPPGATRGQERPLVRLHWGIVLPHEICTIATVPITTAARIARDALCLRGRADAVALLDQGLHHGSRSRQLLGQVAGPLSPRCRAWADLADGRSASPLETHVRLLLHDAALSPDLQVPVALRGRREPLRIDLGWERLKVGIECDGREWHEGEEPVTRDLAREVILDRLGWKIVRVTWRQLRRDPDWILGEVRRQLALRAA